MSSERRELARPAKSLVLDANILVRAVLGRRVSSILQTYSERVTFRTPELAFTEARTHLPGVMAKRGISPDVTVPFLDAALECLRVLVRAVPMTAYAANEVPARKRLAGRDDADWPFLALALTLDCPIWTEDQDFFGSGVATWTTDRVEIFLSG